MLLHGHPCIVRLGQHWEGAIYNKRTSSGHAEVIMNSGVFAEVCDWQIRELSDLEEEEEEIDTAAGFALVALAAAGFTASLCWLLWG